MNSKTSKAAGAATSNDGGTAESASVDQAYVPVGEVTELAKAKRDGKTVRVLTDGVNVWKDVA